MNNLTGKQLVEQGIIFGFIEEDNIQQHGVDLNLIKVERVDGTNHEGIIPLKGKTTLAHRFSYELLTDEVGERYWYLIPGVYDITFAQGCKVPKDKMLLIRQRSSLLRNGTVLHSSCFDAGFETEHIGTCFVVNTPIKIYYGARVAQIYAHNSNDVENLYCGQFQGR